MKTLLIYFSLLTFCFSAYSQDSLRIYLGIAAKNNPMVLQKFTEYKAALQKVPQVGSLPDPELSTGIFLRPMELVGGNQIADIRLMQMFPWFGVLKAAKDEMSLMAKAKYESFRDTKLQVFYDVQQTWYELYKVKQAILISEKNLEILRTLERLSLVKFKASPTGNSGTSQPSSVTSQNVTASPSGGQGMGGNSGKSMGNSASTPSASMQSNSMGSSSGGSGLADVYRIQIEIGELENKMAMLRNQQNTVVARFNSFLNRPVQSPVMVPDTLKSEALNIPLMAVSDSMLANNPMLGMLKFEEQSLEARKQMVTRMGYPMIGLGLNYSLINKNAMSTSAMNGKDMMMPMVVVTLPIYRKKYKAMQAEADLQKEVTAHGYQATANSLQADNYAAIQNYQDAQRRITLYARQNQLANQSLNILIKSFSASGAGLTDLLNIRKQTLDYGLKQVEAVADLNTAIARLNRLGSIEVQYKSVDE